MTAPTERQFPLPAPGTRHQGRTQHPVRVRHGLRLDERLVPLPVQPRGAGLWAVHRGGGGGRSGHGGNNRTRARAHTVQSCPGARVSCTQLLPRHGGREAERPRQYWLIFFFACSTFLPRQSHTVCAELQAKDCAHSRKRERHARAESHKLHQAAADAGPRLRPAVQLSFRRRLSQCRRFASALFPVVRQPVYSKVLRRQRHRECADFALTHSSCPPRASTRPCQPRTGASWLLDPARRRDEAPSRRWRARVGAGEQAENPACDASTRVTQMNSSKERGRAHGGGRAATSSTSRTAAVRCSNEKGSALLP